MLWVDVLSTGSHGNCTILNNGKTTIAIDFGIKSMKKTQEAMDASGYEVKDIDYLLLTHAHGDHISSINLFIKVKGNENIYTTNKVANDISARPKHKPFDPTKIMSIEVGKTYIIGTYEVEVLRMRHSGIGNSAISECVGFKIYDKVNDKYILYATDTSTLDHVKFPKGRKYDLLMIEGNYDEIIEANNYEQVVKTPANITTHNRTVKDHLSVGKLISWRMIHDHEDVPLIEMHESRQNKAASQMFSKDGSGKFSCKYWENKKGDK